MTGKKSRPGTELLYSGGNRNDFPITTEHAYDSVKYTELVGRHLAQSEDIVVSQSLHNGRVSIIFASSRRYIPRPPVSWASRSNYDSLTELVNKNWTLGSQKSKQIYSLTCDENSGFGVFFLTNYGTSQKILTKLSEIEDARKDGFKITSCAAQGSTFYIVVTKGSREFKGKQVWFSPNSWAGANRLIQQNQTEGRVVTGICYSTGQGKYLVVMMETSEGQIYKKFCDVADLDRWVKKEHKEGFHPTTIFKDPTDDKTLVVMRKDRSMLRYTCRYNCKVFC